MKRKIVTAEKFWIRQGIIWLIVSLIAIVLYFALAPHGHAASAGHREITEAFRLPREWAQPLPPLNPTSIENAKTGTTAWHLSNPATSREIEGYCDKDSVAQGSSTTCYVRVSSATNYTYSVYRTGWYQSGNGGRLVAGPTTVAGVVQTMPTIDGNGTFDCATVPWTGGFTISVPSDPTDWTTGVYLIKLARSDTSKDAFIPLIVRDDTSTADFYMQMPTTTWQAYNDWPRGAGGKDFYTPSGTEAVKVSFNRPYGLARNSSAGGPGIGAGNLIAAQASSPVAAIGYEILLIRWMEKMGYNVAYCTDVDNATNGALMLNHRINVVNGHDEYWPASLRTSWENARAAGKHLFFCGSNICFWQTRHEFSGATRNIVCYKAHVASDPQFGTQLETDLWNALPTPNPESKLVGIRYGANPDAQDMIISDASHWIWAGTGLTNGTHLPGLVTGEIDWNQGDSGQTLSIVADTTYFTNKSQVITYTHASGSIVVSTGTFGWGYGLDDLKLTDGGYTWSYTDARIQLATQNIFGRMLGGATKCKFNTSPVCN